MVKISLLIILQIFILVYASEDEVEGKVYQLIQEKVYKNFDEYDIISTLPIPKSYIKTLDDKNVDDVNCKFKGVSNLYLYLHCDFISSQKVISSFPITLRIKEGGKVVVEKNRKVSVLYIDRNIKIKMLGIALQSGKVGDYIEVKNISTGKVLKGKVVSSDEVIIEP